MSIVIKFLWVICLSLVFLSIGATVVRFYQTNRMLMLFAGIIALLYLASMLYNAVFVLFFKGA
jgi:hypothetical protein